MHEPVKRFAQNRGAMATITCLFAFNISVSKGGLCEKHSHPCTEIVIYHRASGTLVQGGKRLGYRDGSVAVYQPPLQHGDECSKSGTHLCLGVTGCDAEMLPPGMYRANETVRLAAGHIIRELKRGDPVHQSMVECLSGWIVSELQRSLPSPKANVATPASVHVQTARTIFDSRFREPLSIGSVAQELFIHPDYLRQLFRQQLGESPIHYLLRKRIDYACTLLRKTDQPIKEIAARSGLENPYYFSRLFRKWVGQSPSEYRANGSVIG